MSEQTSPGSDKWRRREISTVPQLMTLPEVAAALQVSQKTVRRLITRCGLPHVRFGRVLRFEERDIVRWIEARKEG